MKRYWAHDPEGTTELTKAKEMTVLRRMEKVGRLTKITAPRVWPIPAGKGAMAEAMAEAMTERQKAATALRTRVRIGVGVKSRVDREFLKRGQLRFIPAVLTGVARCLGLPMVIVVEARRARDHQAQGEEAEPVVGFRENRTWACYASPESEYPLWMDWDHNRTRSTELSQAADSLQAMEPGVFMTLFATERTPTGSQDHYQPTLSLELVTQALPRDIKDRLGAVTEVGEQFAQLVASTPARNAPNFPAIDIVENFRHHEQGVTRAMSMGISRTGIKRALGWMGHLMQGTTNAVSEEVLKAKRIKNGGTFDALKELITKAASDEIKKQRSGLVAREIALRKL